LKSNGGSLSADPLSDGHNALRARKQADAALSVLQVAITFDMAQTVIQICS
jgi:hypothetical protein